ncbi:MAG: YhcH/YjgK/YiaL family protein [Ignavibacteriae bacterium HGW-Ignavibacteriae-2]|jgi:YhcH/YjgK/YiaL family protein|nr:YhcH/YjgK/YiaL family protein [Bacteroidota bacterium]PKL89529.1 MAG: YhcH/YjgK/YiaL family protein [Ignavibacteriae bacterium HGW-Ignavibacteriae-2]
MIYDSIENAKFYYNIDEKIKTALQFLSETDFTEAEPGRVDIDGDKIFALIQKYNTKPEDQGRWEAHRNYIDIQFVALGSETIGFVNVDYLDIIQEYDSSKDVEFYDGEGDFVQLNEDEFVVFFPHDAHMPGIEVEDTEEVIKVVVKIAV